MQVNCPNCGAKVTAENINIQKMTAVCSACDTVFQFDLPEAKAKRRKVKQPIKLTVHDSDRLHMEFWTNFRLDRSEAFLSSSMGGVGSLLMGLLLIGASDDVPFFLPVGFLVTAVLMLYWMALTVFNKTHIEMDENTIKVTRQPLPNPLNTGYEVSLAGVTAIKYEETDVSKKEGYDTARYRVWAETSDGSRRTIVSDIIEEYAVFIAQRLEERLQTDEDLDVSRLESHTQDDDADVEEIPARATKRS